MKKKNVNFRDLGVRDYSELSISEINNAVVEMVNTLDLGGGSSSSLDLYRLMQLYLKDIEIRNKIHDVLHSSPISNEGNVDILKNRHVFTFYSQMIKNFIIEFESQFIPEVIGEDHKLRKREDLMKSLDRLFHIYSMMLNDL